MSKMNFRIIILLIIFLSSLGLGVPGTIVRAMSPHPADACPEDASWAAVDYRDPLGIPDVYGVTRRCSYNDSHMPVDPEDLLS